MGVASPPHLHLDQRLLKVFQLSTRVGGRAFCCRHSLASPRSRSCPMVGVLQRTQFLRKGRARGQLLKSGPANSAATNNIAVEEGVITFDTGFRRVLDKHQVAASMSAKG